MDEKFKDRKDAANKLILSLQKYRNKNPLVLAIPRGGVEIGFEIAKFFNSDFSIIISRKLPFPSHPETGFGAIAEDGSSFIFKDYLDSLDKDIVEKIIDKQKKEIERRKFVLRQNKALPNIKDRIIILTDDGIAMGSTIRATIKMLKKKKPKKIIIAVPVASPRVAEKINVLVDEFVVLKTPSDFHAVAQVYESWYDVPDIEVIEILNKFNKK